MESHDEKAAVDFLEPGMNQTSLQRLLRFLFFLLVSNIGSCSAAIHAQTDDQYEFNDSHFHLTNNIQEGPSLREFLDMTGNHAGRVALFGLPLQQEWSYRVDG